MIRWYFILLIILLSCKSQKAERYFDFEEQKTKNVTNATSYKGEYSLQIFSEGRGVIDSVFYDLPDLKITATAKIKGNCEEFYFALRGVGGIFYFTRENTLKRINEEWSEVKVEGFVPPNFNGDKVEILFINDCEKTVYVDDATVLIERERSYPEFPELKKVELNIASAEFDSLKQYRKRAYSHNFIPKSSKVYLPAKLKLSETNYDVDVKLKGDWQDHIYGDKWSFKIKSTKDSTFSFNLQKIEARNYLMEYVYHELLKKTRVLTTDYDFVNLFLNGKSMGVYVKEENVDENYSNRRGGDKIVMKFDDLPFFQLGEDKEMKALDEANIKYYVGEKADTTNVFKAKKLMNHYRNYAKSTSEIIEIENMAKYYAIADFCLSYHALGWINVRFVYDSISNRLSPVGYDGYGGEVIHNWGVPFLAYSKDSINEVSDRVIFTVLNWFNDTAFINEYYHQHSTINIDGLLIDIFPKVKDLEKIIQKEYPDYEFDYNFYSKKQKEIKKYLPRQMEQNKYPKYVLR